MRRALAPDGVCLCEVLNALITQPYAMPHSSPVSRGYEIHHISPFLDYTTKHNRNSLNLGLKLMTRTNKAVPDCDLLAHSTANGLKPLVMSEVNTQAVQV